MSYTYTVSGLLRAYKHFKAAPDTYYRYHTPGIWPDREWSFREFRQWLIDCLNRKINREDTRKGRCYTEKYTQDLQHDKRIIEDRYQRHVIWGGCNLLNTPELKRRFPDIDNPGNDW